MKEFINNRSSEFKRYLLNTSWLMGYRVLSMAVALFVGVYVVRYLGPEQFGHLSYASSFVGLFTSVATLGLDGIIVRELVKNPDRRDDLLGTAFWLKVGGAVLMWICIASTISITNDDGHTYILVAIIAFGAIFQAFNVIDFNYQAEVKSKLVVYVSLVQLVITSIIKMFFIWIEAPLSWFACIFVIDAMLLAVGLTLAFQMNTGRIWYWKWRWEIAKELLNDSWPLILSGMMVSIYMKIDQIMIKEMLGSYQVGQYAAAVRLSEAWYFIPMGISSSVSPAIINAKKQSEELYYQRLLKLYELMVWIAIAIALIITFLAPLLISVLYGDAFLPAARVLNIHIWAGIFVFLGVASSQYLLAENYLSSSFYRTFIGTIVNIISNIILIPKYGINGAAFATLISYAIATFSLGFKAKTKRQAVLMLKSFLLPIKIFKLIFQYKCR